MLAHPVVDPAYPRELRLERPAVPLARGEQRRRARDEPEPEEIPAVEAAPEVLVLSHGWETSRDTSR